MADSTLKSYILVALQGTTAELPVRTLILAKQIGGPQATKRLVNPTLYALQKEGRMAKISEVGGGNPHWYLIYPYV